MDTILLLSESMSSTLAELQASNKRLQELVMVWYNNEYNTESNVDERQESSTELLGLQIEENQVGLRKNNDIFTFNFGDRGELMREGFVGKWNFAIKMEHMNLLQSKHRFWRRKPLREGANHCFDCLRSMEQDLANRVWSRKKKKKREE